MFARVLFLGFGTLASSSTLFECMTSSLLSFFRPYHHRGYLGANAANLISQCKLAMFRKGRVHAQITHISDLPFYLEISCREICNGTHLQTNKVDRLKCILRYR